MAENASNPNSGAADSSAYRGYVLFMLIIVYTFNFVDRQIIGILAIPIQEDLNLSDTQLSLMGGLAFAIFYSTLGIPIAWLSDRKNRTWIITIALAIWSLMTALCGVAQNFIQLFLARVGVGVGEAGGIAPSYSIISDYFPPEKRARALAIYSFAIPIGSALGIGLGGLLTSLLDWRWAFIIVGLAGVIFAPIFKLSMREPVRGRYDPPTAKTEPASIQEVWTKISQKKSFWFLAFGAASSSMMGYGLFFWLPSFLVRSYGIDLAPLAGMFPSFLFPAGITPAETLALASAGEEYNSAALTLYASYIYGGVVLFGGIIGIWLGGALGDRYGANDKGAYARLPAIAFACVLPFFGLSLWLTNLGVVAVVMIIPTALGLAWLGPVLSAFQHIVPPNMRATASAMFLLINNLLGLGFGNLAIGSLSDAFQPTFGDESLRYALLCCAGFYLLAAVLLYLGSRHLPKDWED